VCQASVMCIAGIRILLVGMRHRNERVECITVRLQCLLESL